MSATVDRVIETFGRLHIPASLAYTTASVYAFVKSVPAAVNDMTIVEGVVRVTETAILSIPQVLGGIGLLAGGYMSYKLKQAKQEAIARRDAARDAMEHEREMARFRPTAQRDSQARFPLDPRASMPGEDTEIIP